MRPLGRRSTLPSPPNPSAHGTGVTKAQSQQVPPRLFRREDPEEGPKVSGLSRIRVENEKEIYSLLQEGNTRRKTEPTEMNATSSRSHAVLEIEVCRTEVRFSVRKSEPRRATADGHDVPTT